MFCSRCGRENADEVRFCAECGAPREEGEEMASYRPTETDAEPSDIPPRDLADLLGETFRVYGNAFFPLFAIAIVSQLPNAIGTALGYTGGTGGDEFADSNVVGQFVFAVLAFVVGTVSGVAAILCTARSVAGQKTDLLGCYSRAFGVIVPSLLVAIILTLALGGSAILMLIIVGIPLFFFLLVIWFFSFHAIAIEGADGISALKRSRELTHGMTHRSWWRLFGIGIVYFLIMMAVGIPSIAVTAFISLVVSTQLAGIVLLVMGGLLTPIVYVGGVLTYVDLRVRQEGYDMQALADDLARRPEAMRP